MDTLMDTASAHPVLAVVTTIVAVLATAAWVSAAQRRAAMATPLGRRSRRMSFNSQLMATGGFPDEANPPPPIINALVYLDRDVTADEVAAADGPIAALLEYHRFAAVPVCDKHTAGGWVFRSPETPVAPGELLIEQDVTDNDAVLGYVEGVMDQPLAKDASLMPWWELHLLHIDGGRAAVLVRIHHVIGDGIALVTAVLDVFKGPKGERLDVSSIFARGKPQSSSSSSSSAGAAAAAAGAGAAAAGAGAASPAPARPQTPRRSAVGKALNFFVCLGRALALAATPHDSNLPGFHTPPDRSKLAYANRTIALLPDTPLRFIKALKNAAGPGTTVNDVCFSVVSGAIRRFALENGGEGSTATPLSGRALMPVGFPRAPTADKADAMHNFWAMVSEPMHLDTADVLARTRAIQADTAELKAGPAAAIQMGIQNYVMPWLPAFMIQKTAFDIFSRHSCVYTNVPGVPLPVQFASATVTALHMFFPNLVPQIDFLSHNGVMSANVVFDDTTGKGKARLPQLFASELVALAAATGVKDVPATIKSLAAKA